MDAGAVAHAAHIQVEHLAGKAVLDAVDAVTGGHEVPLLPLGVRVVPQLNLGAVVDIIIGNLHNLAIGSADSVELTLGKNGLCGFLSGCHNAVPSCLYSKNSLCKAAGSSLRPQAGTAFCVSTYPIITIFSLRVNFFAPLRRFAQKLPGRQMLSQQF